MTAKLHAFPGTSRELLEEVLERNPKGVLVVESPEEGEATVSWSSMPLTEVCYLEKVLSAVITRKLYRDPEDAEGSA